MNKKLIIAFFASLGFASCGETTEDLISSNHGIGEATFVDGRADNLQNNDCGNEALFEAIATVEDLSQYLKAEGVHTRAAKSIQKMRNGADAIFGTADDFTFHTMTQLDEVSYVGKVAMRQLEAIAENTDCSDVVISNDVEVIFSPQPYASSHLVKVASLIDEAQDSIDIAMYSYRDAGIAAALESAVNRGVSVRFLFESGNADRRKGGPNTKSARLEQIGVDVRYINKIMHHKYILIDGPRDAASITFVSDKGTLATGSGNWSNSAGTRYDENTVFISGNSELNLNFQREFNLLWGNSRDFTDTESFTFFESDSIDDSMITDDPNTEVVFTSANFRSYVNSRYGNTFSVISGKNTVSDRIVELIESAQTSIRIASGHLRSRQISEALLAKVAANPNLDVKIYLDAQEFVSEYTHNQELQKREACLLKAGSSVSKQQKCLDKGFHYAFEMKKAGIPMKFKSYSYRWHYSYAVQMHHKYIVIDNNTVMSGSYNLSDNAEHNTMENMVIYKRAAFPGLVDDFISNFDSIWMTGHGLLPGLINEIKTSDTIPIVYPSMALTWHEVNHLKHTISSECPIVNSPQYRMNPQRHFVCDKN